MDGKIILKEFGLGFYTAEVLKKIIKNNKNFCHLDLKKNSIGDKGVIEMIPSIKYSNSLVHLDLSSNEL